MRKTRPSKNKQLYIGLVAVLLCGRFSCCLWHCNTLIGKALGFLSIDTKRYNNFKRCNNFCSMWFCALTLSKNSTKMISKNNFKKNLKKFYLVVDKFRKKWYYFRAYGGIAQLARAPALQAGGQEFESLYLHHWWSNSPFILQQMALPAKRYRLQIV